jgi:NAD+ diphosphatase
LTFVPGIAPPETRGAALLFAFRGDELLVADDGADRAQVPRVPSIDALGALGLRAERTQFLGTLDGASAFAIELAEAGAPPPGHRFAGLRVLYDALPADEFALAGTAAQILHWDRGHQFCARCGRPVAAKIAERAKRCDACRVDYFPRIHPAVIVLVHDGPRILMTRQASFPKRWYALVAGFLEPGETLEQCAAREVREETGVAIDDVRYFGSQPWPFPHQVMVGFMARWAGGEIVVDHSELEEARWFDRAAMPMLPPAISIARHMIDAWLAG